MAAKKKSAATKTAARKAGAKKADVRNKQAVDGLRSLTQQIDALSNGHPEQAETVLRYVHDGNDRLRAIADRLEQRGPQGILDDVGNFARRRPGLFLVCALGAGVAVGRLVRSNRDSGQTESASAPPANQAMRAAPVQPLLGQVSA